ncbi:MAG: TIGR00269 family protein [Nanoarchaeota archaeon]|nr:TIGR00269 family protein [Nanoarchaeota archaeon]MBU1004328.1 TIGR00269 family protein [Nanoarchaeota archaeon]MBU1945454.1 TIGR00269 family protein [Nanoarchaeota archaeon]
MKDNSIYTLQAGEKLNKAKFLEYFEKKVRKTIRTNNLIGKKDKILVACSGGKDSTTVLYLLNKITKENKQINVEAIHIDPSIGTYSEINKKNLIRFCKEQKIKLHLSSFREEFSYSLCYIKSLLQKKGIKWKSCTICGILRRYILNKKAKQLKATKLVTGHNLDDEAQNIIMNIFQNHVEILPRLGPITGLKEQKGFIPRIKPLYFCTEEETRLYSKLNNFPVKYEKCPCREEAYRKEIADMLNQFEKHHKATKTGIIQSFLKILPTLKKADKGKASICKKCKEPSSGNICNTCKIVELLKSS